MPQTPRNDPKPSGSELVADDARQFGPRTLNGAVCTWPASRRHLPESGLTARGRVLRPFASTRL